MRTDRSGRGSLRLVLVLAGVAIAAAGTWRYRAAEPAPTDAAKAGAAVRERVARAVGAVAAGLEPQATAAAMVPELAAAWKMRADRTTFQDLFVNEEWWAAYRARFPLSAVVTGQGVLASLGPQVGDLGVSDVVKAARANGLASGLLAAKGRAFFVAAARLPSGEGAAAADLPIVVLGSPLDKTTLQQAAGETGDIVGLSDGAHALAVTGPPSSRELAAGLVGHERAAVLALADGRVGAAWSVGEGTWLFGISPPQPPPPRDQSGLYFVVGGLALALGGLVVRASAPRAEAPVVGPRPTTPATPDGAPAGASSPGSAPAAPRTPRSLAAHGAGTMAYRPTTAADGGEAAAGSGGARPARAPGTDRPTQMGRYSLIEHIGEGGMAEIYFAAAYGAEDFVRHFVVKRMHPHLARNRDVVNQFIDEARLQAGLVHSNIVPVFDFGTAEDEYFMALEYIHGRDIAQVVQRHAEKKGQPLPQGIACYVVHEVLEALAFAHARRDKDGKPIEIVHRDVAPGNVLASYQGEVKLTDFGIAKAEHRVSRTEVCMVKGNAQFMSPEQARGEAVDARTDIFSAGLVLYYCLTGQMLYDGQTTVNRLMRAAVGPVTAQFSQIGEMAPAVAEILRRALAQAPANRYATAEEFKRALVPHAGTRRDLAALMD